MKRRRTLGSAAPKNVDREAARELDLYIDNEQKLYRQRQAIEVSVSRHVCRGQFSATKAAKAFQYVVDEGARMYTKEFGSGGAKIFSKPTRTAVARDLAAQYTRRMRECMREGAGSAGCNDLSQEAVKLLAKCKRK